MYCSQKCKILQIVQRKKQALLSSAIKTYFNTIILNKNKWEHDLKRKLIKIIFILKFSSACSLVFFIDIKSKFNALYILGYV